mmetsp:Transcript_13180/g.23143  ORF Transcript_13180/g.23143 Transcript_13180/m.23143 type:complete len:96 (-) Transcript_13180:92-379(-)
MGAHNKRGRRGRSVRGERKKPNWSGGGGSGCCGKGHMLLPRGGAFSGCATQEQTRRYGDKLERSGGWSFVVCELGCVGTSGWAAVCMGCSKSLGD